MMNAAPAPITARAAISWLDAAGGRRARRRAAPNTAQPGEQRAAPPVAVTEGAGEQEEAGEHQRVRVDDPLELAEVRVEVAREGRERDVDDRVIDDDREQARAEHGEPAASAGVRSSRDRRAARGRGRPPACRSRTNSTTPNAISQTLQRM